MSRNNEIEDAKNEQITGKSLDGVLGGHIFETCSLINGHKKKIIKRVILKQNRAWRRETSYQSSCIQ
jgi:hypothetical protein